VPGLVLILALAAVLAGPWLVLILVACGMVEILWRTRPDPYRVAQVPLLAAPASVGGLGALAWVAFKVGALSYGGGFVIVPLIQTDAVNHHWMSAGQFLNAAALGIVAALIHLPVG